MRVNEFLALSSRRALALGAFASLFALAACDLKPVKDACSITIAPQTISLGVNSSVPVVGTAFDCDGNTIRNKKISYSSNNTVIATVTGEGMVIGVGIGQTTISANANGKSASAQVTVTPEAAATVTVSPNSFVLRVGNVKPYTAVAKNSRGDVISGRTFQWSTSNSAIASVDATGAVTAHAPGNVTIAAVSDNITGTASIQVTLVPIGSCTLAPASQKVTVTGQFQPTLTLRDTASNPLSTTGRTLAWTSDNEVNATVSQTGVITARKAGIATITASYPENTSVSCNMRVEAVDPRIVTATIQQRNATARLNVPKQFTYQLLDSLQQPIPAGRVVTWSSLDPAVLNVSASGLVTGISLGTGRIAIDAEGVRDTVPVEVKKIPVARITLSPLQPTVVQGGTVQLTPTVEDSVGNVVTDRPLEWNSSDPARATVSGTGLVTTFGAGSVTITASAEGKQGSSQINIQQVAADTVVVLPSNTVSFALADANKSFSYIVRDASGNTLFGRTVSVSSSDPSVAGVQGGASTVTSGTVNIQAFKAGTTTFTLRPLNSLGQPEGKTTTVTVTIN